MRIRRLDLIAFGPFTDLSIDLSAGDPGLHLIQGPNEAGKSSALRAIHDLFYGIGARTSDNFVHDFTMLKIGAAIEDRHGEALDFRRRKGNKQTLLESDDRTPLDPEVLDRFLGGVDSETFRSLFGIDHHRLIEGGRAILEGRGQVGQLLFAAGSGLTGLRAATSSIQDELDALFRPRGQKQAINRMLNELDCLRDDLKRHQLPGEDWVRHNAERLEAIREKDELDRRRNEKSAECRRLKRIMIAKKPIGERDELRSRLGALGEVVPLPDDFAQRHRSTQDALTKAKALAEQAEADLRSSDDQLPQVEPPDDLLAESEAIEALHRRLGEYLKGREDRPKRYSSMTSDEHHARDLLVELGKRRDLEEAESLRLRGDEPDLIRELGRHRASIDANLQRHREDRSARSARLEELQAELDAIGPDHDVEPLRRVLKRCQTLGDAEANLELGIADRLETDRSLRLELARLPHWSGSIDDLARLGVPLEETIAEAGRAIDDAGHRLDRADEDLASTTAEIDNLEAQIRAQKHQLDVPLETDLADSRRRRDEGWRLIRRAWLDRADDPEQTVAFIDQFAPGRPLADAFERSLSRTDEQADRLRREAKRVATLANQVAQRDRQVRRLEPLRESRERDLGRLQEARASWADRLRALGLPELAPEEIRAWLRRRGDLVETFETQRQIDRKHDQDRARIAKHREAIAEAIREVEPSPDVPSESLGDRVERASAFVKAVDDRRIARKTLNKDLDRTLRDRDDADRRLRETLEEHADWQVEWTARMARLGLEAAATPAQADSFLGRIDRLFGLIKSARGYRFQVEGIDRDAQRFTDDVAMLALKVAPELERHPPKAAVAELQRRLGAARDLRKERDAVRANRAAAERRLREAEATIALQNARLVALCRESGCESPDQLPDAERADAERARIEAELRRVEDQIRDSSAGAALDDFIVEARDVDADGLDLQIQALEEQLEAIERRRSELDQAIGREGEWLNSQKGGDEAADAAERAQGLLAELRGRVEDYATLRITLELLHRGIEQFRDENQGPVIRRAGALFATLTGGSFEGLRLDEDDQGEPVLFGLRDGKLVGVEALSDGSCDQLYLALRLACLEGWLDRHEPIPLILDDILLNFDDERSASALHALAELSRRTQILFFTHHEHLVELALARLPDDALFVHRLGRSGATVATAP